MMGRSRYYDNCPRGCDTPHPGFRHGRRTRLGGGLDGICHLGRAASLPKAAANMSPHCRSRRIASFGDASSECCCWASAGELTRVHSAFADPRVRWRLCASAALVSVN